MNRRQVAATDAASHDLALCASIPTSGRNGRGPCIGSIGEHVAKAFHRFDYVLVWPMVIKPVNGHKHSAFCNQTEHWLDIDDVHLTDLRHSPWSAPQTNDERNDMCSVMVCAAVQKSVSQTFESRGHRQQISWSVQCVIR